MVAMSRAMGNTSSIQTLYMAYIHKFRFWKRLYRSWSRTQWIYSIDSFGSVVAWIFPYAHVQFAFSMTNVLDGWPSILENYPCNFFRTQVLPCKALNIIICLCVIWFTVFCFVCFIQLNRLLEIVKLLGIIMNFIFIYADFLFFLFLSGKTNCWEFLVFIEHISLCISQ